MVTPAPRPSTQQPTTGRVQLGVLGSNAGDHPGDGPGSSRGGGSQGGGSQGGGSRGGGNRGGGRGRGGRVGLFVLAGLLLLIVAVAGVLAATFDPDAYKPRIEQAVYRATGRTLTLGGRLRIGLFNGPRIKMTDVSLGNLPGGSRRQMAMVGEVKARLAFLPLLSGNIVIEQLELIRPDILLEINADGQPNWHFARVRADPGTATPDAGPSRRPTITIQELRVTDGAALLLDTRRGRRIALGLNSLTAGAASRDDPLSFALSATASGTVFKVSGRTAPLAAFDPADAAAAPASWPIKLELAALGVRATVTGTIDPGTVAAASTAVGRPGRPGRYELAIAATAQDLATLAPLLPGVALPSLKNLHLTAAAAGVPGELPELRQLDLSAGHSDLDTFAPGLVLDQVSVTDPSSDTPIKARAAGSYQGAPFSVAAEFGAPAALRAGQPEAAPFPIALTATAAQARLTAKGGILHPRSLQGLALTVDAQVPQVSVLATLLRRPLPDLTELQGHAELTDGPTGLRNGVSLTGLHLTAVGSDATADLTLAWAPRPAVAGHITAASLNAGDLNTAFTNPATPPEAAPPPGPDPVVGGAVPAPTPPPLATPAPFAAATPAPAPFAAMPGPRHLISDRPIPFADLLAADADLQFAANAITWPDETWRNVSGHLLVNAGRLRLAPFAADLPAGRLQATLAADASLPVPTVALTLHAPGAAVAPLFALLGLPPAASGRLEVDASLHGLGRTPHELAATADGSIGLAMVGGSVDGGAAQAWLTDVLRRAALPDIARLAGRTEIGCLAVRLDLVHGLGTVRALALQTRLLSLTGSGGVNLADETLAMRVRAVASVGIGIAVPFDISGPLRAPRVKPNIASTAGSALEGAAGLMIGRLGGDAGGALGGPSCAAELAVARAGRPGPLPATAPANAAPTPDPAPRPASPRPIDRAAKTFRWLLP